MDEIEKIDVSSDDKWERDVYIDGKFGKSDNVFWKKMRDILVEDKRSYRTIVDDIFYNLKRKLDNLMK